VKTRNTNSNLGQTSDDRSSLAKIPQAFDKLAKEKGPLGAVRAIVGLVMPAS
jgi:hypothetical protein